jgi:hypothetical protein
VYGFETTREQRSNQSPDATASSSAGADESTFTAGASRSAATNLPLAMSFSCVFLYNIPTPSWECPHCHFIDHAADLLRLDFDPLQRRQCGRAFLAVPEGDHPADPGPLENRS